MSYASYEALEVKKTTVKPESPSEAPVITKFFRARTRERVTPNVLRNATVYYLTSFAAMGINTLNVGESTPLFSVGTTTTLSTTQPTAGSTQLDNTLQRLLQLLQGGKIVWVDIPQPQANGTKLTDPTGGSGLIVAVIIQNDPSSSGNAQVGSLVLAPNSAVEIFADQPNTSIDPTSITVSPNGNTLHISMLILKTAAS